MRFYNLIISDPATGQTIRQWSSQTNGAFDPGAHQIQFDVPVARYATPLGASAVKLWGPKLQDLFAPDFNGKNFTLFGGMTRGLPLANPAQQGILLSGTILQAYGNWIGTEMTLDIVVAALGSSLTEPANLVLNWPAGMPLGQALATTLAIAYPKLKRQIAINSNIILAHDEVGIYPTLESLAQVLKGITAELFGGNYPGVDLYVHDGTIFAYDNSSPGTPKELAFTDLIGQPTWLGPYLCQITTVLRGDIQVGNYIKLPTGFIAGPGTVTTVPNTQSQYLKNRLPFQGPLQVVQMRHTGSFRDPDGRAWSTTMNCTFSASP